MQVTCTRRVDMKHVELDEFHALEDIVYPDGFDGPSELEQVQWDDPEWDINVRDDDGRLVAHAGVLRRDALLNGSPVRIAGVAEVLTHPDHRRRGYGAAALREAERLMHDELRVPFALLTCPESAIPFYSSLGWVRFHGTVLAEVEGGMDAFASSAWMLLPIIADAPHDGVLDLQGIPW